MITDYRSFPYPLILKCITLMLPPFKLLTIKIYIKICCRSYVPSSIHFTSYTMHILQINSRVFTKIILYRKLHICVTFLKWKSMKSAEYCVSWCPIFCHFPQKKCSTMHLDYDNEAHSNVLKLGLLWSSVELQMFVKPEGDMPL